MTSDSNSSKNSFRRGNNVIKDKAPETARRREAQESSRQLAEAYKEQQSQHETAIDALIQSEEQTKSLADISRAQKESVQNQTFTHELLLEALSAVERLEAIETKILDQSYVYSGAQEQQQAILTEHQKILETLAQDVSAVLEQNLFQTETLDAVLEFLTGDKKAEPEAEPEPEQKAPEQRQPSVAPTPGIIPAPMMPPEPAPKERKEPLKKKTDENKTVEAIRGLKAPLLGISGMLSNILLGVGLMTLKLTAILGAITFGGLVLFNALANIWDKYQAQIQAAWGKATELWDSIREWFQAGDGARIAKALGDFADNILNGDFKAAFLGLFADVAGIMQNGLQQAFEAIFAQIPGLRGVGEDIRMDRIQRNINNGFAPTPEDREFYEKYKEEEKSSVTETAREKNYWQMTREEMKDNAGLRGPELFYNDSEKESLKVIDEKLKEWKTNASEHRAEIETHNKMMKEQYGGQFGVPDTLFSTNSSIDEQVYQGKIHALDVRREAFGETKHITEQYNALGLNPDGTKLTPVPAAPKPSADTENQYKTESMYQNHKAESVNNVTQQQQNNIQSHQQTIVMATRTSGNRVNLNH